MEKETATKAGENVMELYGGELTIDESLSNENWNENPRSGKASSIQESRNLELHDLELAVKLESGQLPLQQEGNGQCQGTLY